MSPLRLLERHGRVVLLLTALVAAAGALAWFSLPSDIYPPLQFPRIVVVAHSGSTPPGSMVLGVTRPLEQALMEVPGIRRVRSKTFRGAAEVSAQFEPSTDMIVALQQAQNRIAEVRDAMPAQTDLTVERLTPAAFPILSVNLTGGLPVAELRDAAYYVIRPALSRVPGVGRVDVMASDTREIEVVADPVRLLAAGLSVGDVAAALRASNALSPVGRYVAQGSQHLVLVSGLWDSVARIAQTPIAVRSGAALRVGDVAEVFPGAPDRTQIVTGNGQDAAIVNVAQQVGANILEVRAGVEDELQGLARTLPSGLKLTKVYDLAEFVATAIANVRDAILVGGLLAVLVLLAFLRDLRMTLLASLTLPLTVLATFLCMRFLGESINLMSMGGLAVAIGLVIDDAVVVVENIHRHAGSGTASDIVHTATSELIAPVVGSTLTTVVVLVPLGLLSGVVGQFFRALSLTLSVAVTISLVLSLSLIPLLAPWAVRRRGSAERHERPTRSTYPRLLATVMRHPLAAVIGAVGLAVAGGLLYFGVPSGFLPHMDEGGFVLDYLTPPGSALEETDRLVRRVESLVAATPEVASFSRRTGSELGMFATQQNTGDILVRLKPRRQRSLSADEVITKLRAQVQEHVPGIEVEFVQLLQDMIGDLEGAPTPIELQVFGDDADELERITAQIEPLIKAVPGLVDFVGLERGNPELTWQVDPVAAGRLGLSIQQVADQLAAAWQGEVATELRLLDRSIPVRVRYPDAQRFDAARLAQAPLRGADGKVVPLGSLARPLASNGQGVVMRENLRQMALLTARLEERDLGSAVKEIRNRLSGVRLPVGYTLEIGGQYASQRQAFRELLTVLGVAAALVLLVLVAQFREFVPALLILGAAPLSFAGAFLLLWVTGTELNVSSAMGLILLIGLAVKNGIVMLDYAHKLHERGVARKEAIAAAAAVRLRPILMTTLCTLFGLAPLAVGLGAGAELQQPLALAVIGGLGLSTVLTLFAIPTIYAVWVDRWSEGFRRGGPS
ncbi:MAG TPA: efflux RND transporter permease subunit [Candidatus Polarisedimenticolaceae bacterium]|nr:efflux RND transporter permease subunit [Candidatus Polarisedimenticolaceae bacterium]